MLRTMPATARRACQAFFHILRGRVRHPLKDAQVVLWLNSYELQLEFTS